MAVNNTEPTKSVADNYAKYAEYFEKSSEKSVLSIETFFQLLMAEMSNQDPLEPTSNTEFISQLANFTALQNSNNTLYYNTVSYAASLAGKTVTVATHDGKKGLKVEIGVVTGVDISDGTNIEITVNGKRYLLSEVMNVSETAAAKNTSGSDGAYAVSLIGKQVTLVAQANGGTLLENGIVEAVEIEDGEYRVVVNGYSYSLSDVIKVNNPESGMTVQPGTNDDEDGKVNDTDDDEPKVEEGKTGDTETSVTDDDEELREMFS